MILTALLAVGLAFVHIFAGQLRFLDTIPRSRWLSMAGGVSVAYVFVHLLPELNERQRAFEQSHNGIFAYIEDHVYLVALIGLAAFYGLERAANISRRNSRQAGERDTTSLPIFWLHVISFSIYNALIGYLLVHRQEPGTANILLFTFAMALHFIVNDYGLRENHKRDYDKVGRWILAIAIVFGFLIGQAMEIQDMALGGIFAFVAGGVILNVLKEELPEERESRFWAFALGAAGYTLVLLIAD
jgi:zinc transporter ZupT